MLLFLTATKKNLQPEKFRKNSCKSLPKENEPANYGSGKEYSTEAGCCSVCTSMYTRFDFKYNSFILWVSEKSIFLVCKVAKNADRGIFWNIIN